MNNHEDGKYLIDYQFITSPLVIDRIGLYQIGKKVCSSDTYSPPHLHLHWFELTIARSGQGIITTNGREEKIESGDIYLSFPYDVHSVRSSPENELTYQFFSFYFTTPEYKSVFDELVLNCDSSKSRIFRNSLIPELVDLLIMILSEGNYSENRLFSLTLEQLVLLIPKFFNSSDGANLSGEPKTADQLTFTVTSLYSVKQISLEDKYSFIFSISELIFSFDAILSFAISSCSLITTICSLKDLISC